jgi:hypothetical protein
MTFDANPRRMLRSLLAWLALAVTFAVAIPCPAASPNFRQPMAVSMAHCAPCCDSAKASATSACCKIVPQPAQPETLRTAAAFAPSQQSLSMTLLHAVPVSVAFNLPAQPAPPPLLHPILRI